MPIVEENGAPRLAVTGKRKSKALLDELKTLAEWMETTVDKIDNVSIRISRLVAICSENQLWIEAGFKSESDYARDLFPRSLSTYWMYRDVGASLAQYPEDILREIGISKCRYLASLSRHNGGYLPEESSWLEWARTDSKDEFIKRVKGALGREGKDGGFLTIKVMDEARTVFDEALRVAALEAGSDKSKSHLMTLIAGDYLAGHHAEGPRLGSNAAFAIGMVRNGIKALKGMKGLKMQDIEALVSEVRSGLEGLKAEDQQD